MTNPLIRILNRTLEREKRMTDEDITAALDEALGDANDRREGYCDGLAGKRQTGRSIEYRDACDDGAFDRQMMAMVGEWQRRAAISA